MGQFPPGESPGRSRTPLQAVPIALPNIMEPIGAAEAEPEPLSSDAVLLDEDAQLRVLLQLLFSCQLLLERLLVN